ncbi:MAG: GNAT family N-acetyltransferase, partial [Erysipelotrichia bacterium]|nr:GNAT family N-acetyltransferase [Erysipelotrichia bacterium]
MLRGRMMIKRCKEQDRSALLEYLRKNAPINLFFIGDIENYGLESDILSVWTDEDEFGIHAVYMNYIPAKSLLAASYEHVLDQAFIDSFLNTHEIRTISGESTLLGKCRYRGYEAEECWFARLDHINNTVDTSGTVRLKEEDIPAIVRLEEVCFPKDATDEETLRMQYQNHSGRNYGVFADGRLVSSAGSTAECSDLAMAVAVCTDPEYRDRHYGSACIARLSNELLAEGKTPCLFY